MSSSQSLSVATSKSTNIPPQNSSSSQLQTNTSSGIDSHPQRRSGGSGSFGAGSLSRGASAAARSSQSLRKQHKGQRRPRLADEDAAAESAVMHSTRNRKGQTSITHLMNFVLPPRPQNHHHSQNSRGSRGNLSWGLGSGYHAVDKARYIHANYRFIVDPRGDYRAQAVDADVHLDWNSVLQILASAQSQSANCPICLSTPVAPRMAKCGHIFCLPCLIRYMHSTDESNPFPEKRARWKKCPICWDIVYMAETRPVRWFTGQEASPPQEGEDVVLRLVARPQGSMLALPRDGADALGSADDIPWYYAAEVMDYARVMKGNQEYMEEQFDTEIKELERQEQEDELIFGEETLWTKKAVAAISEAKGKLKALRSPPVAASMPSERNGRRTSSANREHSMETSERGSLPSAEASGSLSRQRPSMPLKQSSSELLSNLGSNAKSASGSNGFDGVPIVGMDQYSVPKSTSKSGDDPPMFPRTARSSWKPQSLHSDTRFFFYEALLHFYLSPLDIRILKAAFGDYSSFPSTILPRVERISGGHIVDDELRRRAKYLAHLPQGCEVAFLECNWTDLVKPEVLQGFTAEIERRRQRNQDKALREEKARVRAEKEEDDKRWAVARRRRPLSPPEPVSENEFQQLPSLEDRFGGSPSVESMAQSSSPPWPSSRAGRGSAFASLASPSTSPVAPRTVWGTAAVAPISPVLEPILQERDGAEDDGWLQNWEQDLLQENDLALQLETSAIEHADHGANPTPWNGKKKKGKKITLMTTNARRGA